MSNRKKLIVMVITLSLILVLSSSYALLRSTKVGQNNYVINVGDIKVNFQDSKTNTLTASKMYPMTDEEGKEVEQELVFTVKNEGTVKAYYNVWIEETSTNPEFKTVIKYIVKKDTGDYNYPTILSENKYIDSNAILEPTEEATYHVKVYLDESADNTYMGKTFNAKIHVESSQEFYVNVPLLHTIKNRLDDTNSVNDGETTYLSGDNDTIKFNYVWYSGKLWRVTAINPDNTIKMITQDAITIISWGEDITYKDKDTGKESWIYQWLNEDFLDTLENQENIIVQDAKWYVTEDSKGTPEKPTGATIDEKVGLLNAYEYYQSYKNLGSYANGYLNIGYYWWLITTYDSSNVRLVSDNGSLSYNSPGSEASGVRPSVNLKSDIKISGGEGTKENPYRIEGDKAVATIDDKLNSGVSGEYVNFDGKKYRIVGIENETTKLTSVDYVRNEDGEVMIKNFGSDANWATSVTNDSDDKYWSYYLNNTWYSNISETYKNMLVKGTYYLGTVGGSTSYKNAICSVSNTTETTKECSKTSSTWNEGYVGLPRVGEMFTAQLGEGWSSSSNIWLITPNSLSVRFVFTGGNHGNGSPGSTVYGVRPSIILNSNVKITSGQGTNEKPYEIKCDNCNT